MVLAPKNRGRLFAGWSHYDKRDGLDKSVALPFRDGRTATSEPLVQAGVRQEARAIAITLQPAALFLPEHSLPVIASEKKLRFLRALLLAASGSIGYGWDVVEVIHTV